MSCSAAVDPECHFDVVEGKRDDAAGSRVLGRVVFAVVLHRLRSCSFSPI